MNIFFDFEVFFLFGKIQEYFGHLKYNIINLKTFFDY